MCVKLQVLTGLGASLGKSTTSTIDKALKFLRMPVNVDFDFGKTF